MNTLIIWNEIPKDVRLFLIPNEILTNEHVKIFEDHHRLLINVDESLETTEWLFNSLENNMVFGKYVVNTKHPFFLDHVLITYLFETIE